MDYQKLLLEHLDLVDRVVRYVARRHHLSQADADEFTSVVRFKLIDRDFAILRKFQGRSNLATYLTTVIDRLYLDFRTSLWGKWRPSKTALRLGPVATLLERLIVRDNLTFDEAVGTMQTNHRCNVTREELHALLNQLPVRAVRRFAGEEELTLVAASVGASDPALDHQDDLAIVDRVERALAKALATCSARQQLILKFHFQDGMTIADIGRALNTSPKPLYRQLREITQILLARLREEGIEAQDIDRIVGHPALTLGRIFESLTRKYEGTSADDDPAGALGEPDRGSV